MVKQTSFTGVLNNQTLVLYSIVDCSIFTLWVELKQELTKPYQGMAWNCSFTQEHDILNFNNYF